jgi:hypothetical protein
VKARWAAHLEGKDALAYDELVLRSPSGHAVQTREWAPVAAAGGPVATSFVLVEEEGRPVGAALVQRPRIAGVSLPWAWIDRGPVTGRVEDLASVTRAVALALRARGVARLRISPYWAAEEATRAEGALRADGWRDVQTFDGPHASTLRLPLAGKSQDELFAGKVREQVRWRAGQATRAGAVARRGARGDWTLLRTMHGDLMRSQGRRDKPAGWWEELRRFASDDRRGALFACDHAGATIAVAAVLRHGPLAVYAWGAAVPDRLPFSKAVLPLMAAVRWARDAGCSTFDLGGIPLEGDPDPKRAAIATFKYDFDRTPVRLVREHAGWC